MEKKILYNITYSVDKSVLNEWTVWMTDYFIPKMVNAKQIEGAKMVKVLVEEELGGITYSVQYKATNLEVLEDFLENEFPVINKELMVKYGKNVLTFMTLLEEHYEI